MGDNNKFTIGQWCGAFIFLLSSGIPGLELARTGAEASRLAVWFPVAVIGGTIGGALLAPAHRLAGAAGGLIAGPMGLLSIFFYVRAQTRPRIYRAEAAIVQLIASLPGLGVYFVLRLLTDTMFGKSRKKSKRRRRDDDDEEEERPRRRRDEEDEADRRRRPRARDDDEAEEDRPRRRRRVDDDEDEADREPPPLPRRKSRSRPDAAEE
jgi:hypothetical protein